MPAECFQCARGIELAPRLPVRLRGIKPDIALKAAHLRNEAGKVSDASLLTAAEIDRLRAIVALHCRDNACCAVPHVQELAGRLPRAPDGDRSIARIDRLDALADERGYNVRRSRVEVVARPIQIRWQQVDRVEAELLAIGLRLYEQHLLGQSIRGVRLFWIAGPEIVLVKRHRGELWIRADRANRHKLLHARKARALHE